MLGHDASLTVDQIAGWHALDAIEFWRGTFIVKGLSRVPYPPESKIARIMTAR